MHTSSSPATGKRQRGRPSRAWFILPVLGAGLLCAAVMVLLKTTHTVHSVSQVTNEIHRLALRHSPRPGIEDGGPIGPWWIAAASIDPFSGDMNNFRLRSGNVRLAARRAHLVVNAEDDSFSFELVDVVYAALPGQDATLDHNLLTMERFTLGPAPYEIDIVADHEAPAETERTPSALPNLVE